MEHHRLEECRGLMGTVVARYGGEEYVAVDVRLADGQCRLFRPRDLEEISPKGVLALAARWGRWKLIRASIHPSAWKDHSRKYA
jgi:hypothetical protein